MFETKLFVRTMNKFVLTGCLVLLSFAFDQNVKAQQSPNIALQGSTASSVTHGVDVFSGKLEQILPLLNIKGRGEIGQGLYLPLRNTEWRVFQASEVYTSDRVYRTYRTDQMNYVNIFARAGYQTLGQLEVETKYSGWFIGQTRTVTEVRFTSSSGAVIHFRDVLTNGEPYDTQSRGCIFSAYQPPPNPPPPACSRGRVFRAIDGSNATFVADADVYDMMFQDVMGPSPYQMQPNIPGTVYLNNGTRFRIETTFNNVTSITDRNGNLMKPEYVTEAGYTKGFLRKITDSLNREITIVYGDALQESFYDEIVYRGFGGAERRIRINYTKIENVMLPGQSLGVALFSAVRDSCNYLSNGAPCDPGNGGNSAPHYATSLTVPSSVVLPNGQAYQFYYNNYLEVARIKYPAGSYTDYSYGGIISGDSEGVDPSGQSIYRRVLSLKNYSDTGQLVNEKTFSNIPQYVDTTHPSFPILDNVTIDVKDNSGTVLSKTRHYFYDSPLMQSTYMFLPMLYGKEHKSEVLDPVSEAVLNKAETTWKQREPFPWCSWLYACDGSPDSGPPVDPRITEIKTTLETGQVTKKTFGYDQYNNMTDSSDFDYGPSTPGALLHRTHTDYVTASAYIESHLLNLPSRVSVYDSGDIERGRTTFEYDNYSSDSNHAPLTNRAGISGCDPAFSTSYTIRGNRTAKTNYLLPNGSVTTYEQYDIAGNAIKAIDANGFATTVDFSDHFGGPDGNAHSNLSPFELSSVGEASYAFATSTTNSLAQVFYNKYDYYTARTVTTEDANGLVSNAYSNNEPLDRPTKIIVAVNTALQAQTIRTYDDVSRTITSTSDLDNNRVLVTIESFDSFGRSIETRQSEGGSNYIVKQRQYDALGRVNRTSNPYRPWQGESVIWTQAAFDALGRVISVTTPDNAVANTAYSGNQILVTDQTGKQRMSRTNAGGQSTDVWEITAPDSETESVSFSGHSEVTAGYHTSYAYDALGDLTSVTQGTQTQRSFVYDSTKRLITETRPESGTTAYQYDDVGNMLVKTDARGVSTHVSYDAASRPVRRWYNGSSLISSTAQNNPVLPSGVSVSDEVKFFYDSQTLPSGAPAYSRGFATGRLVAVTYGSNSSAGDYFAFDIAGQPTLKIQQTGGINYQIQLGYNFGGAVTSLTYPSGHSVTYNYEQTGRLGDKDSQNVAFSGNLGDGISRTYSAGILYSPLGGMTKEKFGTDTPIYNKRFYNSRGQLAEIRESTSYTGPTDTNWDRGAIINFYSTCWGMCGGSNSTTAMTDNNGNLKRQEVYIPLNESPNPPSTMWAQQYDYDSLNRLQRVHEYTGNTSVDWQQEYVYDRYGNRKIHQTNTWGVGINKTDFTVITASNRLGVPSGQTGTMAYDNAGNLTADTYSGLGLTREFDAENRMTSETQANAYLASSYSYNARGLRVRRTVNGVETRQVYGIDGELLAEYAANSSTASPLKEYGYRNGQLLIVAGTFVPSAPAPSGLTAAPSGGGSSITLSWSAASGAAKYRVERKGAAGSYVLAGTSTSSSFSDTEVTVGAAYLYKVCSADSAGNCTSSFGNVALGAAVTFTDPTVVTTAEDPTGATATPVKAAHITQLRSAVNAVRSLAGLLNATWTNSTIIPGVIISAADVSDLRQNLDQALTALGIQLSTYTDSTLAGAPNGSIIKRAHITELRQRATSGIGGTGGGGPTTSFINWLVTDHLGTPRMIFDKTGSLANVKRHDYLPFGEEVFGGSRATSLGYGAAGDVRQRFTAQERDDETGLDFFSARYYASKQGRFISVDPRNAGAKLNNPQSWNGYAYALNNPFSYIDPSGLDVIWVTDGAGGYIPFSSEEAYRHFMLTDKDAGKYNRVPSGTSAGILKDVQGDSAFVLANNQMIGKEVVLGSDGNLQLAHPTNSSLYSDELVFELGYKRGPALKWWAERMWEAMSFFTVPVPAGGPITKLGLEAAEEGTAVTVTHFTNEAGMKLITESRTVGGKGLQPPYVTLPSQIPSGINAGQVEKLLEIAPGKGQYSITFTTHSSNLVTPVNGSLTSGRAIQFQLARPVPINSDLFVRTPAGLLKP